MGKWVAVSVIGIALGALCLGQEWPMGGRDPGRSSATPEDITAPLAEAWSVQLPDLVGSLIAAGDMVIATIEGLHLVLALDLDSGEERWRFQIPGVEGTFRSTPAIAEGLVFVGGQLSDVLYALDLVTGEMRWQLPGLENLYSDPCAVGELVVVGSPVGLVTASAATGEVVWRRDVKVMGSPAVGAGLVFVKVWVRGLRAYTLNSGEQAWQAANALSGSPSDPVLVGKNLAVVMSDTVHLWDVGTGRPRGRIWLPQRQPSGTPFTPAADGWLFVPLSDGERSWLIAVDTGGFRVRWTYPLPGILYTPCVTGQVIYAAAGNSLVALDRGTGEPLWQRQFPAEATTGPIAASGAILCAFGDTLYRLASQHPG